MDVEAALRVRIDRLETKNEALRQTSPDKPRAQWAMVRSEADEIVVLRHQNEVLSELVAHLVAENERLNYATRHAPITFPPHWGLTAREANVLASLMADFSVRSRELLARVSPGRDLNNISVFVFRLREKLGQFGVKIECSRGPGYSISPAHNAIILREIEAASFPPIAPVLAAMVAGRQASGVRP